MEIQLIFLRILAINNNCAFNERLMFSTRFKETLQAQYGPQATRRWLSRMFNYWLQRAKLFDPWYSMGIAIVIGSGCGFAAVIFQWLIRAFHKLFWGTEHISVESLNQVPWWMRLLIPALGGLMMSPIIRFFAPEAKGHGVPEVMAAVARKGGVIKFKVGIAKAIASAITIASGGSAGREGPIIQIGAAIGSTVARFLRVSTRRVRIFVGCGAAAGIASTFNAPIAGTLFAVEVILGEFGLLQFSPIVMAAVTATVISRSMWGSDPVFEVPAYQLNHPSELILYLVLGVLCGLVAVAYIQAVGYSEKKADTLKKMPYWSKPMLGGLGLGIIAVGFPHVMGDGYSTVDLALNGNMAFLLLAVLLVLKIVATSLTLGSGGSGGVFAPSLFIGAMTGGLVGHIALLIFGNTGDVGLGSYALVGMGGLVAGAMHSPITAMIILFEMTNDYEIILPLMVVCITANLVSSHLCRESIYTIKLVHKGIDVFKGRSLDIFRTTPIEQCMTKDYQTVSTSTSAGDVIQTLMDSRFNHLYLTDQSNVYHGVISLNQLRNLAGRRDQLQHGFLAVDLADETTPQCFRGQSLSDAMLTFQHAAYDELPVLDGKESRMMIGVIRYRDIVSMYNEEIILQDSADGMLRRSLHTDVLNRVKIVEGFSLLEWPPPADCWHKTLEQLQLPGRFGVYVMLVKSRTSAEEGGRRILPLIPDRSYRVEPEDTLLVCGKDEKLDRLPKREAHLADT
ncbi:MAG: chloride channel protein [Verrucomicrobia bacterium]|nr:chloride channel protein [Verrucomicrobiota bacterium]